MSEENLPDFMYHILTFDGNDAVKGKSFSISLDGMLTVFAGSHVEQKIAKIFAAGYWQTITPVKVEKETDDQLNQIAESKLYETSQVHK